MPKLTDSVIQSIGAPAKGRKIVTDTHRDAPRGFALRVNANGTRVFVLRYSVAGKDRLLTIGEYGTSAWSLAAARKQAGSYRRQIDAGHDVLEDRRMERREPTVQDVVDRFLKAKKGLKSATGIESVFRLYLLPELGSDRIQKVRRREVIALVEGVAESTPRQAALLLTYIKQLFSWAEDRELIEGNPVATLKAGKINSALSPRSRRRVLDQGEIKAFWKRVDDCGLHKLTALALKLILVTGQRPGEVAGMRWKEVEGIDFAAAEFRTLNPKEQCGLWTIPAERRGKTNTSHTVPLTPVAVEILQAALAEVERLKARRGGPESDHVFQTRPGRSTSTGALDKAVARYAEKLGAKDKPTWGYWTPHDLRRTMRTGLSAAGVNDLVAELTIGHTRKGIAAVYDLHRYDSEKRKAIEAWERRLSNIVSGRPADDNVVPLQVAGARHD